jgi:hypothetical protein
MRSHLRLLPSAALLAIEVGPFSAELAFERPRAQTGAVVVRAGGGLDGVSNAFSAIGVRFAAG